MARFIAQNEGAIERAIEGAIEGVTKGVKDKLAILLSAIAANEGNKVVMLKDRYKHIDRC